MADVLEARRFERFGGFARAALWVMLLTVPAILFFPERIPAPTHTGPLWSGLLGGLLFGLGAALNKGCSFSTLQRLADADRRMLATLAGFLAGNALWYLLPPTALDIPSTPSVTPSSGWLVPAMAALMLWAVVELALLWRRRAALRELIHAESYSPAATALLLGLGAGLLYLGFGPWTYTNSMQSAVGALIGDRPFPSVLQLALVPALFAGMLLSAWQRGSWRVRKRSRGWVTSLMGGTFMGLGGALIPGGNDTLLLRLIPSMAPHSLWIYLTLIAGVAGGLVLQRRLARDPCERAGCGGDALP